MSSHRNLLQRAPFLLIPAILLIATNSMALSVSYSVADLPDQAPGQDLYRYDYALDGFPYAAGFLFSIRFDPTRYASLQSPPPGVGPDWDVITLQPDVALPDDGLYDALALTSNPSTLTGFAVEFVWLGVGAPGAQPFSLFDASFSEVLGGQTVPVPEPGTMVYLGMGLVGIALKRRS